MICVSKMHFLSMIVVLEVIKVALSNELEYYEVDSLDVLQGPEGRFFLSVSAEML
jgi:hypothetical protein